jgi:hypothetical protein
VKPAQTSAAAPRLAFKDRSAPGAHIPGYQRPPLLGFPDTCFAAGCGGPTLEHHADSPKLRTAGEPRFGTAPTDFLQRLSRLPLGNSAPERAALPDFGIEQARPVGNPSVLSVEIVLDVEERQSLAAGAF